MSQGEPQGATMSQATTCLKQGDGGESPPALPPPPGSPHIFPPETLFRQAGGVTYRIPALLYVPPDDSFLAFAEKRSSARDEDAKYLVLRRGRRHGCSVKWGPVEELSALALPRHRTMNPCPLFDARSGTVFLFCICVEQGKTERCQIWRGCSAARLCFASSADGGRGWSALRDVTGEAIGADLARWATFAVGPGHGVQLRSGRLVVPAYAYYVHGALRLPCFTRQHSLVFYSDDGGRRWHKGAPLGGQRTGECQVAEIPGGQRPLLYCSARAPRGCRAVALSADQGLRFQRPAPCPALGEPPRGCQGSVLSFAAAGARTWLLYSHPTDRRGRRDLGLYVNPSPLDGAGWRRPWVLHAGPAGYSDLAACPGLGVFGCLFECGASSACEEIAFCLFTLDLSGDRDLKAD